MDKHAFYKTELGRLLSRYDERFRRAIETDGLAYATATKKEECWDKYSEMQDQLVTRLNELLETEWKYNDLCK